ncbi:hypothetical protein E4T56_gene7959 [Termitomyces sp. T112]|nr:hypothetical protein E4T56_gene7959 [Termitomyces sp. T112]
MVQRIFQGWEQQHEADLEEDSNDLGPQNNIPSEDDLEYVDPAEHQPVEQLDPPLDNSLGPQDDIPSDDNLEYIDSVQQRHAEDWDPAPPNHLAGLQNSAEQPPLELPIPPQLGSIQPILRGRQPYLIEYPPHYLGPMTVICPHCQALHFDAEKLTKSTIYNPKFGMCCLQSQGVSMDMNAFQQHFPAPPLCLNVHYLSVMDQEELLVQLLAAWDAAGILSPDAPAEGSSDLEAFPIDLKEDF